MHVTQKAVLAPFDPLDSAFRQDPYPIFKLYREADPIHFSTKGFQNPAGTWNLFRYQDIIDVFKHPDCRKEDPVTRRINLGPYQPFADNIFHWLLSRDPPYHTRLRGLLQKPFTSRSLKVKRKVMGSIAESLLDRVVSSFACDWMACFGQRFPLLVVADLLGLPLEDGPRLAQYSSSFGFALDMAATEANYREATRGTDNFNAYFREVIPKRRANPGNDLLSKMITAHDAGKINEQELLANAIMALVGGHETTIGLLGSMVIAFAHNPDQWDKLKREPALISRAADELLRIAAPSLMTIRFAHADLEIGDRQIRKGERIVLWLASGNRDPEQFTDPDRLDITRDTKSSIALGYGLHYCIGGPLVQQETEISLEIMCRRIPNFRLLSPPKWKNTVIFRIPEEVRLAPGLGAE